MGLLLWEKKNIVWVEEKHPSVQLRPFKYSRDLDDAFLQGVSLNFLNFPDYLNNMVSLQKHQRLICKLLENRDSILIYVCIICTLLSSYFPQAWSISHLYLQCLPFPTPFYLSSSQTSASYFLFRLGTFHPYLSIGIPPA